jgi:hypothetical protein
MNIYYIYYNLLLLFLRTGIPAFNNNNAKRVQIIKYNHDASFIKGKKLITVSPGGYKGFYTLGICKYLKTHYNLDDYIFSGASAGAWNSLMLCYKHDIQEFQYQILDSSIQNTRSIIEMENNFKSKILERYSTNDFDLSRLYIGATTIQDCRIKPIIFSDFESLEDALNCCISSSHIPGITGNLTNKFRDTYVFDGGFSSYPYLDTIKPSLHITPSMWKKCRCNMKNCHFQLSDYTTLFSKDKYIFANMINDGYNDAIKNQAFLDAIFLDDRVNPHFLQKKE